MLENSESLMPGLLASLQSGQKYKVVTLGTELDSMAELTRLLDTLEIEVCGEQLVNLRKINPASYFGQGKIEEMKTLVEGTSANALVIDVDLSPNQLRNIETLVGKPVLDRSGVILEIFSQHARTKEAKTQVALARLQYLLPRLAHFWNHFERQRGGGATSRGMGEKQIEVDRRLVKDRIAALKTRLKQVERERKTQRSARQDVLKVAIVGYTNAGKSTMLNALTQSKVLAEDKLFATLDASVRMLDPDSKPPIVLIDTVGFIRNLPTTLVASFRSTLEAVCEADLILHLVDGSSDQARDQYEVTEKVLNELGVEEVPRLLVLNKMDRLSSPGARNRAKLAVPGAIAVSALNPEDVKLLRTKIQGHFHKELPEWEVLIPYSESKLEALLHQLASIVVKRHHEKGTYFKVKIANGPAKKMGLERYKL